MLWIAPAVQRVGMSAAFAQVASGPTTPPPQPPVKGEFPSHIDLIVRKGGVDYGVKYDESDSPPWDKHTHRAAHAHCLSGREWRNDEAVVADFSAVAVSKTVDADGKGTYTLTLPAGYQLVAGFAKCGRRCVPPVSLGNATYAFSC